MACLDDSGTFSRFRIRISVAFSLALCVTHNWRLKSGLHLSCFRFPSNRHRKREWEKRWRVDTRTHPRVVCVVTSFCTTKPQNQTKKVPLTDQRPTFPLCSSHAHPFDRSPAPATCPLLCFREHMCQGLLSCTMRVCGVVSLLHAGSQQFTILTSVKLLDHGAVA